MKPLGAHDPRVFTTILNSQQQLYLKIETYQMHYYKCDTIRSYK